jgi:hypothetical protein
MVRLRRTLQRAGWTKLILFAIVLVGTWSCGEDDEGGFGGGATVTETSTPNPSPALTPSPTPSEPNAYYPSSANRVVYFADGYHGGAVFPGESQLPDALQEIVDLLDRFPAYRTALEVEGHAWEQLIADPGARDVLERIRPYVASGRVELVGGTYSQPYLYPNDPESIVRQFLFGKKVVEDFFRVPTTTYAAQEPDFTTQLPQILRGTGFRYLKLFNRWMDFGAVPVIDDTLFFLRGPDGSRILTSPRYSMQTPLSYWDTASAGSKGLAIYPDRHLMETTYAAGVVAPFLCTQEDFLPRHLTPWPGFDLIESPSYFVRWTTPRAYFDELLAPHADALPVALGDRTVSIDAMVSNPWPGTPDDFLPFPWGIAGGDVQRAARQMETHTLQAERWAALASHVLGSPYPASDIDDLWRRTLKAQNHDQWVVFPAPGKLIDPENAVLQRSSHLLDVALGAFADTVNTTQAAPPALMAAQPFVLFNPHLHALHTTVELPIGNAAAGLSVFDDQGQPIPSQLPALELSQDSLLISADIPPIGFRTYYAGSAGNGSGEIPPSLARRGSGGGLQTPRNNLPWPLLRKEGNPGGRPLNTNESPVAQAPAAQAPAAQASIDGNVVRMESDGYRLEFDLTRGGTLTSLTDKELGRTLIGADAPGNVFTAYFPTLAKSVSSLDGAATARVVEAGPVRAVVAITNGSYPIPYTSTVTLTASDKRVSFETTFNFRGTTRLGSTAYGRESWRANASKLNVRFPLVPGVTAVLHDAPAHSEETARPSFWALRAAASVAPEAFLGLLTDRPSAFVRDASSLGLVLTYAGRYGIGQALLTGPQRYAYALVSGADPNDEIGLSGRAVDVALPALVKGTTLHDGNLPAALSLLQVSGDPVELLTALIDSGRLVLRLFNPRNQQGRVAVDAGGGPLVETDLRGRMLAAPFDSAFELRPFGLHTVYVGEPDQSVPLPVPTAQPYQVGPDAVLQSVASVPPTVFPVRYYLKPQGRAPEGRASSAHPGIPQPRKDKMPVGQVLEFVSDPLASDLVVGGGFQARLFIGVRSAASPPSTITARVEVVTAASTAAGAATALLTDCVLKTADDFFPLCYLDMQIDLSGVEGQTLASGDTLRIRVSADATPSTELVFLYDSTLFPSYVEVPVQDLMAVTSITQTDPARGEFAVEVMDRAGSADLHDVGVALVDPSGQPLNDRVAADFIADETPTLSRWRFVLNRPVAPRSQVTVVVRNTAGATASSAGASGAGSITGPTPRPARAAATAIFTNSVR